MAAVMFDAKKNDKWVAQGCDICHKGMMKKIYDFQREHRKEGTICSTCDKKQRKRDIKDDTREIIN